eukprot:1611442-Prymnesium_polylepis.1
MGVLLGAPADGRARVRILDLVTDVDVELDDAWRDEPKALCLRLREMEVLEAEVTNVKAIIVAPHGATHALSLEYSDVYTLRLVEQQ